MLIPKVQLSNVVKSLLRTPARSSLRALEGRRRPRGPRAQAVCEAAARPERVRARLRGPPPAPQRARLHARTDRQGASARVLRLLLPERAHSGGRAAHQPPHGPDGRARAPPGHVTRRDRRAPRRPAAAQLPRTAGAGRPRVHLRREVRAGTPEGTGTAGSETHLKPVQRQHLDHNSFKFKS